MDLGEAVIAETRQINSFLELRDRQTNFTNRFVLPETGRNKAILEMMGVPASNSLTPYRLHEVSATRNGIPTIQSGVGTIQSRNFGRGYPLNIQFGNNSLFNAIEDLNLSDLDWSTLNHTYADNTISLAKNNDFNGGYIYCIADFGVLTGDTEEVDARYQLPSVFRRWIWDKIFSEAGFTYSYAGQNNVFETEDFNNELITISNPIEFNIGVDVDFSILMDNVSQTDFIKSMVQDFGLMFQRVGRSNNYEFISFNDFIGNNQNIVDFSNKYSSTVSFNGELEGYARSNYMRYNYDNDDEDFADGVFNVDNETIESTQDVFESPYIAPTGGGINVSTFPVLSTEHYELQFNSDGSIKDVRLRRKRHYVHKIVRRTSSVFYVYDNGQRRRSTFDNPYVDFTGLFYQNIISRSYLSFASNLQRPKLYVVELALNAIDVSQFNFFNLIYIKQLGGYFYMNKITNYRPGQVTRCEIVGVEVPRVFGAYSDAYSDAYDN